MFPVQGPWSYDYPPFFPSRGKSVLLVRDFQESLVKTMDKTTIESVISKISLLIKVAKRLGIPIIWTETVEPLKALWNAIIKILKRREK